MASSVSERSAHWAATRTDRKSGGALSPQASPAAGRRSSALQSEIRSMIAQTEQLLSSALSSHESPPRTSAMPLRLTRLTSLDASRFRATPVTDSSDSVSTTERTGAASDEQNENENELSDGEVDASARVVRTERQEPTQQPPQHRLADGVESTTISGELAQEAGDNNEEEGEEEALGNQAATEVDANDGGSLQRQPLLPTVTNRDINGSKARALQESMLVHLVRLGFYENLTRLALDAGAYQIEHDDADADCGELAYVDIFVALIKMVCDAHVDAFSHQPSPLSRPASAASNSARSATSDRTGTGSASPRHTTSAVPFKWPVFDMAQFEFGNARTGTCFDSVCVLTNLPKVAAERTEELMEMLSCSLFCMLSDPVQVVLPSVSATGRTKGHAFVEFNDPIMARRCAAAVDGLAWGRGPFGRIRSSMFREYQVKSPTVPQLRSDGFREGEGFPDAPSVFNASLPSAYHGSGYQEMPRFSDSVAGGSDLSPFGRNAMQFVLPESLEDRDEDAIDERFPPLNAMDNGRALHLFPDSVYTSSEGDGDDDDGDDADDDENDDDDIFWQAQQLNRHPLLADVRSSQPRSLSIDEADMDDVDDPNVVFSRPACSHSAHVPGYDFVGVDDSHHLSSDSYDDEDEADDDDGFGFVDTDTDDSWEYSHTLEAHSSAARHAHWGPSEPRCGSTHASSWQPPSPASAATQKAAVGAGPSMRAAPYSPRMLRETQASESETPWRSYCEELIARNREMQEQVAFARRRIVQLGHNNQKLHLLVDRVERDRDGLVFENDVLQSQLKGLEDHERHREALLDELAMLRKRLRKKEPRSSALGVSGRPSTPLDDLRFVLQHELGASALAGKDIDELRQWEALLESSLVRVRGSREEKALALQKKLDRQVEEQQELKLCVICLASEKSILCLPCRHLCLCEACSARDEVTTCPICRLRIDEMLLVYA